MNPDNLMSQLMPKIDVGFEGCGSQKDFYRRCFREVAPAISPMYKEISNRTGNNLPTHLKFIYSIGSLKSDPQDYTAAVLTNPRPNVYEVTFNENNPTTLELYKSSGTVLHEFGHGISMSKGLPHTEAENERLTRDSAYKAGKHEIAKVIDSNSKFIGKLPYIV